MTWEHEDDYDPLVGEIAAARNAMLAAEARMRLLIAYGREFTRPRPYRPEELARAAGMSVSGVRTAYDDEARNALRTHYKVSLSGAERLSKVFVQVKACLLKLLSVLVVVPECGVWWRAAMVRGVVLCAW